MRFNVIPPQKKLNHEGAKSFALNVKQELYSAVVTASLSDSFYEKNQDRLARIRALIAKNNPVFVAKLAIYARKYMHMRSVPLVLAVELAKIHSGDALVRNMVDKIVLRADEITELLAYYQLANQRTGIKKLNKLSKQIQRGLELVFQRFDEYQFAKYDRAGVVTLRDALFLVHPKAKDATTQQLFDKIAQQTLATPYTWETELSALGQQCFESEKHKTTAFKAKWEELIDSGKLGYMALLRNLRNMLEYGISETHLVKVAEMLANENAVKNAKQLPFRFLAAYREMKKQTHAGVPTLLNALEDAVSLSAQHIKGFGDTTRVVIACDVSGSMQQPVSPRSQVLLYDIGLMLGMLLQAKCRSVISGIFGDHWKIVPMAQRAVLGNVDAFYKREGEVGYSTNGYKVIKDLVERKTKADKVMLFTDCQLWDSSGTHQEISKWWKTYKAEVAPNARLYLFDLAGYGQIPVRLESNDVFLIAGWSDKIFDVLNAIEEGVDALSKVENIDMPGL